VMDHLQPRICCAEAKKAPRGPGSAATPPLHGTLGGGGPPASPSAPCTSRETTQSCRAPPSPPPKSFWVRWRTACHLQIALQVPMQAPRTIPSKPPPLRRSSNSVARPATCKYPCGRRSRPPLRSRSTGSLSFTGSVSVVIGPPQPSDRTVVMAPREPSIVPTTTGPQKPRSVVTKRVRSPLHACLSQIFYPVHAAHDDSLRWNRITRRQPPALSAWFSGRRVLGALEC